MVRGAVEFSNEVVSDPILLRSSGVPVYNYVVVIDDAEMQITHVIRGDDHLSNTPKQVALYEALGWPVPEFAHLSTILGPDRERLSKRHGATSLAAFREMGVLPEALMNYMVLLGWAPAGRHARNLLSRGAGERIRSAPCDSVACRLRLRKALLAGPALHQRAARLARRSRAPRMARRRQASGPAVFRPEIPGGRGLLRRIGQGNFYPGRPRRDGFAARPARALAVEAGRGILSRHE